MPFYPHMSMIRPVNSFYEVSSEVKPTVGKLRKYLLTWGLAHEMSRMANKGNVCLWRSGGLEPQFRESIAKNDVVSTSKFFRTFFQKPVTNILTGFLSDSFLICFIQGSSAKAIRSKLSEILSAKTDEALSGVHSPYTIVNNEDGFLFLSGTRLFKGAFGQPYSMGTISRVGAYFEEGKGWNKPAPGQEKPTRSFTFASAEGSIFLK